MVRIKYIQFLLSLLLCFPAHVLAATTSADKIVYEEKEEGTDFYRLTYTVSDKLMRIDDSENADDEEGGFIVFDIEKMTIFSISHFDKTILVIPKFDTSGKTSPVGSKIFYEKMDDAPSVSGKSVYEYKVFAKVDKGHVCMDLKIADGLLPGVASKLKLYQSIVSAQQIRTLETVPEEYQTPCYLIDQIYNTGDYFDKGLPLHEWHSNKRIKTLVSFDKVEVDSGVFALPEGYQKLTLDEMKH